MIVQDTYISKKEESRIYKFSVEIPPQVKEEDLIALFAQNCSLTWDE